MSTRASILYLLGGRISKCHLAPAEDCTYTVEYVDDVGAMKSGDFRGDEIEGRK